MQQNLQRCVVCCSTVRRDGSAETRGLRPVDTSQPTLREQFRTQQQAQQSARWLSMGIACCHFALGTASASAVVDMKAGAPPSRALLCLQPGQIWYGQYGCAR